MKTQTVIHSINSYYKKTDVGLIPSDWKVNKIEDCSNDIFLGLTSKVDYVDNGGFPLIRATDISSGKLSFKNVKYISEMQHKQLTKYRKAEKGDVLVSKSGTLGTCTIVDSDIEFSVYESIIVIKTKKNEVDSPFLLQLLQDHTTLNRMLGTRVGGSVGHLNLKIFRDLKIPIPPIKEQQKISSILSSWDKVIDLKEKVIEQKNLQKKGLMQNLLTGKIRLSGFTENWINVKFGDVLKFIKKDPVENPNEHFLLTVKLHLKGIEGTDKKPNVTKNGRPYYLREPNELLIGRQNFHNGGIGIVPQYLDGFVASNAISSLTASKGNLKFYYFYLTNGDFYKKIEHLIGGTGQKEISESMMNKLNLYLPSNEKEQIAIVEILENIENEINLLEKECFHLKQQKKGLMQLLLTGKVRVKV
ncbi:restriction endonuclease subunit S [Litchfieldia alkalitelluris]|uniref:restriction endonuclease subunit S n=1 Tax=Litchfieldia alkalitelluris TaxID=304268 RepID=UPI0009977AD2|nr:restriction endonuclease subunit S [Litchfieldia alkalitelluris]